MSAPGESTLDALIESTILTHEAWGGGPTDDPIGVECSCGWSAVDGWAPADSWQQYAAHLREQITTTIQQHQRQP